MNYQHQGVTWPGPLTETHQLIWHLALQNAFEYEGKGAVQIRYWSNHGFLTIFVNMVGKLVLLLLNRYRKPTILPKSRVLNTLNPFLLLMHPISSRDEKNRKKRGFAETKNLGDTKPVFRFAPNPNGPLSFGHARGIVINGSYAEEHKRNVFCV